MGSEGAPRLSILYNGSERELTVREALLAVTVSYLNSQGFEGVSDGDIMPYLESVFDACAELHLSPKVVVPYLDAEFKQDRDLGMFYPQKLYLGQKLEKLASHCRGMRPLSA